jgi:hypothetical protein
MYFPWIHPETEYQTGRIVTTGFSKPRPGEAERITFQPVFLDKPFNTPPIT